MPIVEEAQHLDAITSPKADVMGVIVSWLRDLGIPAPDLTKVDSIGLPIIICLIAAIYVAAFLVLYL